MNHTITKQDLINFEEDIAAEFNASKIKAPVHLYSGNEDQIIDIFKNIKEQDWIFCSWRSHYQCLLKGVPKDELKKEIMAGHSISLNFPEYKIMSSAIVSGIIPIALGTALDIKRSGDKDHVWCFVGDMTSETGCFYESLKYANKWELPITFVIEDNKKSVCTDTYKTWNISENSWKSMADKVANIIYYDYETKWPHAGAGTRVQF